MDYVIVMDVSGDIDVNVAKENDIRFLSMEYSIGDEMRTCSAPESDEILTKFYNGQRNGDLTKTSQITPFQYEDFMKKIFAEGKSVLYLCLSSGLSSTYQSACMAKQELSEEYPDFSFYPVDTLAATGGMGVLCERAIRNKKNGMTLEENYNDILLATKKIKHWFVVEDLMYLKRGGRISATTAVLGTALNIRPILEINTEGKLDTVAKKRGNKASLTELLTRFQESYDETSGDVIYVIQADSKEKSDELCGKIRELYPNSTIRTTGLTPIIGAHTGPGMAAICYMGK